MDHQLSELLTSQKDYYRARADEYDDVFVPYMDPGLAAAVDCLRGGDLRGDVLEIACGTGYWTPTLADVAASVTSMDNAAEMIEVARDRGVPGVRFLQADVFAWEPDRRYDSIFFGHWLAHVPDELFDSFWAVLDSALADDGVVAFIDVTPQEQRIETADHAQPGVAVVRQLEDGRSFRIVKQFRAPEDLRDRLAGLGWLCEVTELNESFFYAACRRSAADSNTTQRG